MSEHRTVPPTSSDPTRNAARRTLYRFTALAFADPLCGTWSQLADAGTQTCVRAACEFLREEPAAIATSLGWGEIRLDQFDLEELFARLPDSPEALNAEYEQTFGLLVAAACPPYETEYISEKLSFQRAQQLADISGFYRAFGVEPGAERPDHVALELEFLALLIDLEARAETKDQFVVSRDAQSNFVANHLAWWLPSFAQLLWKESPQSFFAASGRLLCAFLPTERALLKVEPPSTPIPPSRIERPEECEGCSLHAL